jgi:hypothetical protein
MHEVAIKATLQRHSLQHVTKASLQMSMTSRHPSIRKKLALTSPASCGRSVGIVRAWTKATELLVSLVIIFILRHVFIFCALMWF